MRREFLCGEIFVQWLSVDSRGVATFHGIEVLLPPLEAAGTAAECMWAAWRNSPAMRAYHIFKRALLDNCVRHRGIPMSLDQHDDAAALATPLRGGGCGGPGAVYGHMWIAGRSNRCPPLGRGSPCRAACS